MVIDKSSEKRKTRRKETCMKEREREREWGDKLIQPSKVVVGGR